MVLLEHILGDLARWGIPKSSAAKFGALSGNFKPCMMVPAVTEVCWPQAAHPKVKGFPPCGPRGRAVNSQAAQAASSGSRR